MRGTTNEGGTPYSVASIQAGKLCDEASDDAFFRRTLVAEIFTM